MTSHLCRYYTIGYSHKTTAEFLRALRLRKVATLIDVRHAPVSRHRPEFSKRNLQKALEGQGIAYAHLPSLGVPKEIRDLLSQTGNYDEFFEWYDKNVIPHLEEHLDSYLISGESLPVAFMCVEEDQSQCHRSRIAAALKRKRLTCIEIG